MEKKDVNNIFDEFLNNEYGVNQTQDNNFKKVISNDKGLIERIEKKIVTPDGRQLLRETYK